MSGKGYSGMVKDTDTAANGVTYKEFRESFEYETGNDLHSTSVAKTVGEVLWDRYCDAQYQIKAGS